MNPLLRSRHLTRANAIKPYAGDTETFFRPEAFLWVLLKLVANSSVSFETIKLDP
jgi:hypothetical protein